jgi:hypothetical protein
VSCDAHAGLLCMDMKMMAVPFTNIDRKDGFRLKLQTNEHIKAFLFTEIALQACSAYMKLVGIPLEQHRVKRRRQAKRHRAINIQSLFVCCNRLASLVCADINFTARE